MYLVLCVLLVSSEIIHNQCEQCESLFGSTADLDRIPHPGTTNCTNMSKEKQAYAVSRNVCSLLLKITHDLTQQRSDS